MTTQTTIAHRESPSAGAGRQGQVRGARRSPTDARACRVHRGGHLAADEHPDLDAASRHRRPIAARSTADGRRGDGLAAHGRRLARLHACGCSTCATDRAAFAGCCTRTFQWRIGLGGWLLVIAALPAATVALGLLFGRELVTADLPMVVAKGFGTLALLVLVVNLWEETIWAGFVQPRLERRHRAAAAAALTAIPFALVHMPARVRRRTVLRRRRALGQFVLLMIISVPFRTLLGVTIRGLGGSVLAVAFMHTSFNRSNNTGGLADQLLSGVDHAKFGLLAMLLILGATTYHWRSQRRSTRPPAAIHTGPQR